MLVKYALFLSPGCLCKKSHGSQVICQSWYNQRLRAAAHLQPEAPEPHLQALLSASQEQEAITPNRNPHVRHHVSDQISLATLREGQLKALVSGGVAAGQGGSRSRSSDDNSRSWDQQIEGSQGITLLKQEDQSRLQNPSISGHAEVNQSPVATISVSGVTQLPITRSRDH